MYLVEEKYPELENVRHNKETFIIGGGVTNTGKLLFDAINEGIKKEAGSRGKPGLTNKIEITRSTIGPVRAIYGAVVFAREMEILRDKEIRDLMDELWIALRKEKMDKKDIFRIAKMLEIDYGIVIKPIGITDYMVQKTSEPESENYRYIVKEAPGIVSSSGVLEVRENVSVHGGGIGFLLARKIFDAAKSRFGIEVTVMDRGKKKGDIDYGGTRRGLVIFRKIFDNDVTIRQMPEPEQGFWIQGKLWLIVPYQDIALIRNSVIIFMGKDIELNEGEFDSVIHKIDATNRVIIVTENKNDKETFSRRMKLSYGTLLPNLEIICATKEESGIDIESLKPYRIFGADNLNFYIVEEPELFGAGILSRTARAGI